jgi:hypothetical protein
VKAARRCPAARCLPWNGWNPETEMGPAERLRARSPDPV